VETVRYGTSKTALFSPYCCRITRRRWTGKYDAHPPIAAAIENSNISQCPCHGSHPTSQGKTIIIVKNHGQPGGVVFIGFSGAGVLSRCATIPKIIVAKLATTHYKLGVISWVFVTTTLAKRLAKPTKNNTRVA